MLPPPMPPLPGDDPPRDPIEYVLGVGGDLHLAGFFERQQALNRRHLFHPVVGGTRIESAKLLLYATEPKYAGPPAWPGITETKTVIRETFSCPRTGYGGATALLELLAATA